MIIAESPVSLQVIWAPAVSAVLVALIGYLGIVRTTAHKAKEASEDAKEASEDAAVAERASASAELAAQMARDYALALQAKNALIESQGGRITALEEQNERCEERCNQMEERMAELMEAQRSASLLERELRSHLEKHNKSDPV